MPNEKGIWSKEEALEPEQHLFSYRLAQFIAKKLKDKRYEKVFDMGCGLGSYVKYLQDVGFVLAQGVEGSDLKENSETQIKVQDLTEPFYLGVGNVICLEVAEHIPSQFTYQFIKNICNHVDKNCFLFLSWAVEGQEGHGHINCKNNDWVISAIEREGFKFQNELTKQARAVVESHLAYFKETILIFKSE